MMNCEEIEAEAGTEVSDVLIYDTVGWDTALIIRTAILSVVSGTVQNLFYCLVRCSVVLAQ